MTAKHPIACFVATGALVALLLVSGGCKLWLTRGADPRTGEGKRLEQDQARCLEQSQGVESGTFESCMKALGWTEAKIKSATSPTTPNTPAKASEDSVRSADHEMPSAEDGTPASATPPVAPATATPQVETGRSIIDPSTATAEESAPESASRGWWKLGGTPDDLKRDRAACAETGDLAKTNECLKSKGWKSL